MAARSKTRKNWKLFPEFFKSEFSILAIFGNYIEQKTRTWEFATLSFLKKKFFIILKEVILVRTYVYVLYYFRILLKCFFLHQNYKMIKISSCRGKLYLL